MVRPAIELSFLRTAENLFDGVSPLCAALCRAAADDAETMRLAGRTRRGQFAPLLLMVAVHDELLRDPDAELAAFYPSLTPLPKRPDEAGPAFLAFCRDRFDRLAHTLGTRAMQTTEVRRCATLLPALALAGRRAGAPLALLDMGCGAGLALRFDRYRYRYEPGGTLGDGPLVLTCAVRGTPPLEMPQVAWRAGLDLEPLDVRSPADRQWMVAHLWPNERFRERRERLESALALAVEDPPPVRRADMIADFRQVLEEVPDGCVPCLVHCYSFYELPPETRAELDRRLAETPRRLLVAGLEWEVEEGAWLEVRDLRPGQPPWTRRLARVHVHGESLEWLDPPA